MTGTLAVGLRAEDNHRAQLETALTEAVAGEPCPVRALLRRDGRGAHRGGRAG